MIWNIIIVTSCRRILTRQNHNTQISQCDLSTLLRRQFLPPWLLCWMPSWAGLSVPSCRHISYWWPSWRLISSCWWWWSSSIVTASPRFLPVSSLWGSATTFIAISTTIWAILLASRRNRWKRDTDASTFPGRRGCPWATSLWRQRSWRWSSFSCACCLQRYSKFLDHVLVCRFIYTQKMEDEIGLELKHDGAF